MKKPQGKKFTGSGQLVFMQQRSEIWGRFGEGLGEFGMGLGPGVGLGKIWGGFWVIGRGDGFDG